MQLNPLTAISPIDGRYFNTTQNLSAYFSEFGLMRYRIRVEVEYFIALTNTLPELSGFSKEQETKLRLLYTSFNEAEAGTIKEIEKETQLIDRQHQNNRRRIYAEEIHTKKVKERLARVQQPQYRTKLEGKLEQTRR